MADDIVASRSTTESSVVPDGERISAEEVTTLNGATVTAKKVQRVGLSAITADGTAVDWTDPPTSAKQDTGNTSLATIAAVDFATETSLAAVLAKLSADPATQTTLAAILAKIIAAPATEAKQDTGNTSLATIAGVDFATQTTLAAILAKIIAAPATEAKQDSQVTLLTSIESYLNGLATAAETQPVSLASVPALAAGNNNIGDVDVASIAAGDNNIGNVDIVTLPTVSSATVASVSSSATSVTLLASNAARKGASFYNNSTKVLYLKLGATATASDFTVAMAASSYYELPQPVYTGVIDGIWASANGAVLVTSV